MPLPKAFSALSVVTFPRQALFILKWSAEMVPLEGLGDEVGEDAGTEWQG